MTSSTIDADLISQLPDHIIHHILSFLSTKDAVRVSVLSKEWYAFFTYFPISDFSNSDFGILYKDYYKRVDRRLEFINFVYTCLLRQSLHSRYIPKFQLSLTQEFNRPLRTTPQSRHQLTVLIDRCIRLGTQYGVKELALEFPDPGYRLPKAVFLSARQLVVCRLASCVVNAPTMNWPSLRELSLDSVEISDQKIIDNLIFTCPFIEKFALVYCFGLDYLTLSGLKKLKKVKVRQTETKKIEVDALSLQTFSFSGRREDTDMNIIACKNLKVLEVRFSNLTFQAAQCLISKFPALKVLVLVCNGFERIKISHQGLEKLKLISEKKTAETIIDAPSLQLLEYKVTEIPSLFSLNTASLQKVYLALRWSLACNFLELNKFIRNFHRVKLFTCYIYYSLYHGAPKIASYSSNPVLLIDINELELLVSPPHAYEHAKADEDVDILFWMFRPKLLRIQFGRSMNNKFMKALCKKLVHREKDQHCSAATSLKRWLHDLKGVEIKHDRRNGEAEVLAYDALLDFLETSDRDGSICFLFEW